MARTLKAKLELDVRGARRNADQMKQSMRGVGDETKKTQGITSKLGTAITGLAAGYVGLTGAKIILSKLREETERIDRVTRSVLESMRSIQALSSMQGRRAEQQQAILKMAEYAGRRPEEVSEAFYTLAGGTFGMTPQRRAGLMKQTLLMAKTDPRASLDALVRIFSTIGTQQSGLSPLQIGNLLSQTIEAAKATPAEMAGSLPTVLSTAVAGGADITTAMAMWSFATRHGGGVAESGTAVRATMLGLLKTQPALQKRLRKYGFDPKASLMEKISWLAEKGFDLPGEEMAMLGGRRGIEAVAAIARHPEEFAEETRLMQQAKASKANLLRRRLARMYDEDKAQRYLDQLKQAEIMGIVEDVRPEETQEQTILAMRKWALKRTRHHLWRSLEMGRQHVSRYIFGEPARGVDLDDPIIETIYGEMENLAKEGYEPAAIKEHLGKYLDWKFGKSKSFYEIHGVSPLSDRGRVKEILEKELRGKGVLKMQEKLPTEEPTTQPTTRPAQVSIGTYYGGQPRDFALNELDRAIA
ncbi:MAG: phage tail tape measure protein [Phycisphaerae bacterium]|nr:phage tail tape measure protein [Phycisphaerae bacterium]